MTFSGNFDIDICKGLSELDHSRTFNSLTYVHAGDVVEAHNQ